MAKIMLVEDDHNLLSIYGDRLLAEGHQIVSAGDGEEALAMAVKEKPDLIIADVMMPKISGFDMLDILRSTPETKSTKVIMMTALSQAEDKARADKLGADKYLVKSQVTLDDVARIVNEVLVADGKAPASSLAPAAPAPEPIAPTMQSMSVANAPVASTSAPTPSNDMAAAMPTAPEPASTMPNNSPAPMSDPLQPSADNSNASLVSNTEPLQAEQQEVANQINQAMASPAMPNSAAPMPSEPASSLAPAAPAPTASTAEPTPPTDPMANFAPPVPSATVGNDMHVNTTHQTSSGSPALGNGPALGDRVVQPLPEQSVPKPDINQLYQNEMAKEQASTIPVADTAPTQNTTPDTTNAPAPADPGNISL